MDGGFRSLFTPTPHFYKIVCTQLKAKELIFAPVQKGAERVRK